MFSIFSAKNRKRNFQKFTSNSMCVSFSIINIHFYCFAFRQQRKAQLRDRESNRGKGIPGGVVMFKQMGEEGKESRSRWEGGRDQKQSRCGGGRGLILVKDKGGQI